MALLILYSLHINSILSIKFSEYFESTYHMLGIVKTAKSDSVIHYLLHAHYKPDSVL